MRSRRRLTVRAALTAWYLLVLCLVIVGFSLALYWNQEQTLSAQVDRSLAGASGQAMALIDKHVEPVKFVDACNFGANERSAILGGTASMLFQIGR